ncbi:MAG TPA: ABC transporter ATP-binding protein [Propionibacteriaceae bacterium]
MTHDVAVRISDLHKHYGPLHAVDGVSLTIERGETFALLGPNGAGKSTTIEILEGYRHRASGSVSVLGVDPDHGDLAWKARLGIVGQSTVESDRATVRELLTLTRGLYPDPRDVDEVIAAAGLEKKASARCDKLSGGQRRRLDVAMGVIGRPELLFLDEPTTGFDPEARREFWQLVHSLKDGGTTIILTTHYLDEAAELADRVGIITGGRLLDVGAVDEIGGADARRPVVRWRSVDGERRTVVTDTPASVVAEIVAHSGSEPRDLEVIRPSLEDIYLTMISDNAKDAA